MVLSLSRKFSCSGESTCVDPSLGSKPGQLTQSAQSQQLTKPQQQQQPPLPSHRLRPRRLRLHHLDLIFCPRSCPFPLLFSPPLFLLLLSQPPPILRFSRRLADKVRQAGDRPLHTSKSMIHYFLFLFTLNCLYQYISHTLCLAIIIKIRRRGCSHSTPIKPFPYKSASQMPGKPRIIGCTKAWHVFFIGFLHSKNVAAPNRSGMVPLFSMASQSYALKAATEPSSTTYFKVLARVFKFFSTRDIKHCIAFQPNI